MKINELTEKYIENISPLALSSAQKTSLSFFKERGLPHTKMEDWLYTKLMDTLPEEFKVASKSAADDTTKLIGKYVLYFSNGYLLEEKSNLPKEITLKQTNSETISFDDYGDDNRDIFAMINGTVNNTLTILNIAKNYVSKGPITIIHSSDCEGAFATPRIHVNMETHSECNFIEVFKGSDEVSYNQIAVTNFKLAAGAKAKHIKVQTEGNAAFHAGSVNALLKRDSHFKSFTFNTGALKARHNLNVALLEPGSYSSVDGLYALKGNQHCDNFSLINHVAEHTDSSQLFKGVLNNSSRGVFTGRVLVARDAQQVNSEQLNKNLLLTKKAHVHTRPQLEVYADDVKCAHGATVGQMSDEEAFYLQSRGLSRERAQKLLLHAYCADAISKVEDVEIEQYLSDVLFETFEKTVFENLEQGQ